VINSGKIRKIDAKSFLFIYLIMSPFLSKGGTQMLLHGDSRWETALDFFVMTP
jgi:hypothetical protein